MSEIQRGNGGQPVVSDKQLHAGTSATKSPTSAAQVQIKRKESEDCVRGHKSVSFSCCRWWRVSIVLVITLETFNKNSMFIRRLSGAVIGHLVKKQHIFLCIRKISTCLSQRSFRYLQMWVDWLKEITFSNPTCTRGNAGSSNASLSFQQTLEQLWSRLWKHFSCVYSWANRNLVCTSLRLQNFKLTSRFSSQKTCFFSEALIMIGMVKSCRHVKYFSIITR